ncbi:hypothetical protein [Bernardetia sp.]|uniref:hypothetical protein n=1 Tax=Bernardetia sp. TaxID=1937974 RepID=UPI0025C36816|nr:hypothetical protein [Bernardetia sp.]
MNKSITNEEIIKDIVIQVLVKNKSAKTIYDTLNKFLPNYDVLDISVYSKFDNEDYVFKSELEVIDYFISKQNIAQRFYWTKNENNLDNVMVGVNLTEDNMMVISLTIDGTLKKEAKYYSELQQFLNSEIGVISYFNPAEYKDGKDFIEKYSK